MRVAPPFTHLHVASGYSLRYAAVLPDALVQRAAEQGMSALALTDRDSLAGAVKFVQACEKAQIAPILGVDVALSSADSGSAQPRGRTPIKGGAFREGDLARVTVVALAGDSGLPGGPQFMGSPGGSGRSAGSGRVPGAGWAQLCQLVSAAHAFSEAEQHTQVQLPETQLLDQLTPELPACVVLLGPQSPVGRAALVRRHDLAVQLLHRWKVRAGRGGIAVELVCHFTPESTMHSLGQAVRMWRAAREAQVPVILTNAVRHPDPEQLRTVQLLDAVRQGVLLRPATQASPHASAHLASSEEMLQVAQRIAQAAGAPEAATELLSTTANLAAQAQLDPRTELGMGSTHLPEPSVLGLSAQEDPQHVLTQRVQGAIHQRYPDLAGQELEQLQQRLDAELHTIAQLGYATYFLTVATACDVIRDLGVRMAARGSGAGSLVNYLLGISQVEPMGLGLLMERFLSPLRSELPDIDIDVESARRTEIYRALFERFGHERVAAVSMMDSYRVRHAIRDAGAALGLPAGEIGSIAKAFPHIRAKYVRRAIEELPELGGRGLGEAHLRELFDFVEDLDGLPRHVAVHPCALLLSNQQLLQRTPVQNSGMHSFAMSQFDKDDVEALGLLKLDVLGVRMQSAMAYTLREIERVEGKQAALQHAHGAPYLDASSGRINLEAVPFDDASTFEMIRDARTLGCFQIESPGQRELIGKFAPEFFEDLIIDISLFRPGPVKSDMITPFLRARQGWSEPQYLHPDFEPILRSTCGVVVFHEQVIQLLSVTTGCSLDYADEQRRAMGNPDRRGDIRTWWFRHARAKGYSEKTLAEVWDVLEAFASFGFCKAHAAAFAVPTYQSAWLKQHHPAAFYAGILTHDPGMYPKRLLLDDARNHQVPILPIEINSSTGEYTVQIVEADAVPEFVSPSGADAELELDQELAIEPDTASEPPTVRIAYPTINLGLRLSFSDVQGISDAEVASIVAAQPYRDIADFWARAQVSRPTAERLIMVGAFDELHHLIERTGNVRRGALSRRDLLVRLGQCARLDPGAKVVASDQLSLDLPQESSIPTGLPPLNMAEQIQAELDILGLDVSHHIMELYTPLLVALGTVHAKDLRSCRNGAEVFVAGVKVATQTPPVRSGRRVVFLSVDDSTGPVDATFFEDVQGPYSATVFSAWIFLVRGHVRRTGPAGVSLRATGAWDLAQLWQLWNDSGRDITALWEVLNAEDVAADYQDRRPRSVLQHPTGYRQSIYADVRPAGDPVGSRVPRKLWHASPGSSGTVA